MMMAYGWDAGAPVLSDRNGATSGVTLVRGTRASPRHQTADYDFLSGSSTTASAVVSSIREGQTPTDRWGSPL